MPATAGQSQTQQRWWQHLCDNMFKEKKQKIPVQQQLQTEKGLRICVRNNSSDTKIGKEGRGGGAAGSWSRDSPAAGSADHGEPSCPPAAGRD